VSVIHVRSLRIAPLVLLAYGSLAFAVEPAASDTPATEQSGNALVQKVQDALHADQTLLARHINVRADGDVVTLSGYVATTAELTQAKRDAKNVPGVKKVVDQMKVDRSRLGSGPSDGG